MDKSFHQGNRQKFYDSLENGTIALFFSGHAFRKTADEFFPFYANRNFVYLTGIEKENFVLMAELWYHRDPLHRHFPSISSYAAAHEPF